MPVRPFAVAAVVSATVLALDSGTANAIVGGDRASEDYPFMASLQMPDEARMHCGATLIAPEWLATAAHCVSDVKPEQLTARVGSADRMQGGELRDVQEIKVHPDWGHDIDSWYDIALVHLNKPVSATPAPIAQVPQVGSESRVIGWGRECADTSDRCEHAPFPRQLKEIDTRVLADAECAPDSDGSVETCTGTSRDEAIGIGDSGGPQLVRDESGRWALIGMASRNLGAGGGDQVGKPSLFTDAAHFGDWIEQQGVPVRHAEATAQR